MIRAVLAWAGRVCAALLALAAGGLAWWLDPLAGACGVLAALFALLPYWSHLADALGADAEERWRDRYQGHMRASADAMARETREGALLLAGRAENLALTFQGHAERLQQEVGGARALAEDRRVELAEVRRRLARPKPRRVVLPSAAPSQRDGGAQRPQ